MSFAVHLIVGRKDEKPLVHNVDIVHSPFTFAGKQAIAACIRKVSCRRAFLNDLPGESASCAEALLDQSKLLQTVRHSSSAEDQKRQRWSFDVDVGASLQTTAAISEDSAHAACGDLILKVGGHDVVTKSRCWALQHAHDSLVGLLILQERPFNMQVTHVVCFSDKICSPSAPVVRQHIPRAMPHKHKRTLQKAEHTAMVRTAVPVDSHLDAKLQATPFGVVWATTMHDVDFTSVFA